MKVARSRLAVVTLTFVLGLGVAVATSGPAFAGATVSSTTITTPVDQLEDSYYSEASPDNKWIAITGYASNIVTLVDTTTNTQVAVTDAGSELSDPLGVVFSADSSTVFVALYGDSKIVEIDVATASVVDSITTDSDENIALAISRDGSTLIVSDDYGYVTAFDASTGTRISTFSTTGYIINIFEFAPNQYYLVDYYGEISVLDLNPGVDAVTSLLSPELAVTAYYSCISPDNSTLYFVDNPDLLVGVNPVTNTVVSQTTLTGAVDAFACAVTPGGNKVLVTDSDALSPGIVFEVDVASKTVSNTYQMPNIEYPVGIVLIGCNAYISGYSENIGILELDQESCEGEVTLPNTGLDAVAIASIAGLATVTLLAGFVIMATRRRHGHTD
jgi:WD40 repeat protein